MKPALFLYHVRPDLYGITRKAVATGSRAALDGMAEGLNRERVSGECYVVARNLPTWEPIARPFAPPARGAVVENPFAPSHP